MKGFRLPFSVFRTCYVFAWERHSACLLCTSRRQCRLLADQQSNAANYSTRVNGAFSANPATALRLPLSKSVGIGIRLKSNKSSKNSKRTSQDDDDDDDDDDEPEKNDFEEEFEDEPNLPKDYKDLVKAVQSFRYDVVMKAGLDIARNKVEEAFYDSQLRLNGEKLWKKSRTVKVGDTLDLIVEPDKGDETVRVMRVIVKKVAEEKTGTEKYKVFLRRWKNLQIPKQDVLK